ncbi:MAG: AraC family transcriptional regulator [Ruminococcaceae bacterium]|nr:AraC family transcriptional regulator [Oscillospiraceae bacterium]
MQSVNHLEGIHEKHSINDPICIKELSGNTHNYVHWHEFVEILFVIEGIQCIGLNDHVYTLHAGDFLWIPSRVVHTVNPEVGYQSHFYSMVYDEYYLLGQGYGCIGESKRRSRYYRSFLNQFNHVESCLILSHQTDTIRKRLSRMYSAYTSEASLKRECILRGELLLILSEISDALKSSVLFSPTADLSGFSIEEICGYIDKYSGTLGIDEVAAYAGYSRNRFTVKFKEGLGHTFREYSTYVRMMEAVRMLSEGMSISDTAYKLGYNNICNFSRTFRKYMHTPPSVYLNKNKK